MPDLSFVFAKDPNSLNFATAIIYAICGGIGLGAVRGIIYLIGRYKPVPAPAADPPCHWTDITGEVRPVTAQDCAARHTQLTEELRKGSDRMATLSESVQEVRTTVVRISEQIGAGVDVRIREAADKSVGRHEDGPYHLGGKRK